MNGTEGPGVAPESPNLRTRLEEDYIASMKGRDSARVSVLRMLKAAVQSAEKTKGSTLSEEEMLAVLTREVKVRSESLSEFERAERHDLAVTEVSALTILNEYMPLQLSEDEDPAEVRSAIERLDEASRSNPRVATGRVMRDVMPKLRGRAGGSVVNRVVTASLAELEPQK